jgi:hypothetical protein
LRAGDATFAGHFAGWWGKMPRKFLVNRVGDRAVFLNQAFKLLLKFANFGLGGGLLLR